ncbi:MAG: CARDB domain-containing protein [Acidobacteriota bacterium]
MKKISILLLFLISFILFSQEPPKPIFDNITVSCSVSYDCPPPGFCFYTYRYIKSNPSTNTANLGVVIIPINNLSDDVILPQPVDFTRIIVAHSFHGTYRVNYINNLFPTNPALGPNGQYIEILGYLKPGTTTLYPNEYKAYKPPTIKTLWIQPQSTVLDDYFFALCDYRGIDPFEFPVEERLAIDQSYNRFISSLGPSPAFIGSFDHWDLFISDVAKSKENGWVSDNNLYEGIYQRLTTAREAAYNDNLNLVNAKLDEVISMISASNQNQRKDEFYYLVYYNAQSLKDRIPWPCEPKLAATPDYGFHHIGEFHTIEATLINQANGYPLSNQQLTMEVVEGPNMGTIQEVMTDSNGKAVFSYKGYNEGLDKIEIRTIQGTFAEKTSSMKNVKTKEKVKKDSSEKGKSSKKESECFASDKRVEGLFAEWEGFVDLCTMLAPKVMEVVPGQKINLKAVVFNYGDVDSPASSLRIKMSDKPFNSDPPPEATTIREMVVDCLKAGGTFESDVEYNIPQSVSAGKYYFDACVDPDDVIPEKAEWNNCASSIASLLLAMPKESNSPPDCSKAKPSIDKLWPPNHKLENISIQGVSDLENDPFTITVTSITQDEPTNGLGDGDTSPDGFGVGSDKPQVRAERSGKGNGRVYQINFKAVDSKGAECNGSVKVGVPHDKKDTPIDDGQNYDSTKQ